MSNCQNPKGLPHARGQSAARRLLTVGPGINSSSYHQDPDLTAYWKFDEAEGFVVHDITGNGHDLYMSSPPQWQVFPSSSLPFLPSVLPSSILPLYFIGSLLPANSINLPHASAIL